MRKKISTAFLPFLMFVVAFLLLIQRELILSVFFILLIPLTFFLNFGNLKKRILNLLPIFTILAYLAIGLRYGEWDLAIYLFLIYPFIGILIQPKRVAVKYLTFGISYILQLLHYLNIYTLSIGSRVVLIVLVYLLFLPPYIERKLKNYPFLFQIIAPGYGLFYNLQVRKFKESLRTIEKELHFKENESIVDIGCGTGALATVLASDYNLVVTGIEPTKNMLKVAERKAKNQKIKFLQGNIITGLNYPDNHFDYSCASYVAHGLKKEERIQMYLEMKRVTKHKIILFEYNKNRNLGTDIIEFIEGGDYFGFIKNVETELNQVFDLVTIVQLNHTGSAYICG